MKSILVISDTHIPPGKGLPLDISNLLLPHGAVIHAGDITSSEVLYELEAMRPTTAVYGNCDGWDIRERLKRTAILKVDGLSIGVVHGDGSGGSTLSRAFCSFPKGSVDAIVFGHSHQPLVESMGGVLLVNPGSILRPRMQPRPSYAVITINDGRLNAGLHYP